MQQRLENQLSTSEKTKEAACCQAQQLNPFEAHLK